MIYTDSFKFIFEGIRAVGFVNGVAVMPFAVVFAVAGAWRLWQNKEFSAMKWLGASLAVVGLNYVIYLVYSYFAHSLNSLPLVDIWAIPLLGLGVALLFNARRK